MDARTVVRRDAEFSRLLTEIPDPPARLFVAGRRMEAVPCLAIVGSRRPTRYGLEVATSMARELAGAGIVIVSGLAYGIDAAAHRGALESGTTIAVLGNGIDICYPPSHRRLMARVLERGTIVTEYPAGTPPLPRYFPERNRIIAGMSVGVVIVEARIGGGAMITARLSMEFGREVFAVAGPVNSPVSAGPHSLVRDGARLVTSAADVLEDLGMTRPMPAVADEMPPDLTADERRVLRSMDGLPALLDHLARDAKMPPSAAAAVLARLEIRGLAVRHAGGRFARPIQGSQL